jgi:hypothetical protein
MPKHHDGQRRIARFEFGNRLTRVTKGVCDVALTKTELLTAKREIGSEGLFFPYLKFILSLFILGMYTDFSPLRKARLHPQFIGNNAIERLFAGAFVFLKQMAKIFSQGFVKIVLFIT